MTAWLKSVGAQLYDTLVTTPIRALDFVGPSILARACAEGDAAKARAIIDDDARRDSAEDFCRLKARRACTAMAWIFIPAYCFAIS